MVSPLNYILPGVNNAFDMAMGGMQAGQQRAVGWQDARNSQRSADQTFDMNSQAMADQQTQMGWAAEDRARADQERQAQAAKAEAQQADLAALAQGLSDGTAGYQDVMDFSAKYPELADAAAKGFSQFDDERRKNDAFEAAKIVTALKSGATDTAMAMIESRIAAAENEGDRQEAQVLRSMLETMKIAPESGLLMGTLVLQSLDPEMAKMVVGESAAKGGDRFKVVGDQLIDLNAEGGPKPVEGVGAVDRGPEWVDLTPDELVKYGFVFGQRNTKTGKVEGDKPPKGQTISLGADGSLTITDGVGAGGAGGELTPTNKTAAQKAKMAFDSIMKGLDEYEETFSRTGGAVVPGKDRDALLTARRGLQLQMKELFNLGVLNGPDLELLDSMFVDPADLTNNVLSAVGVSDLNERVAANIAEIRKALKTMVEPSLKALGGETTSAGDSGSQPSLAPDELDALMGG